MELLLIVGFAVVPVACLAAAARHGWQRRARWVIADAIIAGVVPLATGIGGDAAMEPCTASDCWNGIGLAFGAWLGTLAAIAAAAAGGVGALLAAGIGRSRARP